MWQTWGRLVFPHHYAFIYTAIQRLSVCVTVCHRLPMTGSGVSGFHRDNRHVFQPSPRGHPHQKSPRAKRQLSEDISHILTQFTLLPPSVLLSISLPLSSSPSVTELFRKATQLPTFVYGDCMAVCSILYTCQQRVWLK